MMGGVLRSPPVWAASASYDGTITQSILILVHGSAGASGELSLVKEPLENWGYPVEVFDYTEYYDLLGSGDHWYLHDQGGGHGDLDLVVDGNMLYSVIIFDPGDGLAYSDVETSARAVKQMFQAYPFLGIARMESSYTTGGSVNNVFQVGTSGGAAKSLTVANPRGSWALEPLKVYQRSWTTWGALNISARTSDVTVLEAFEDGTPAITLTSYTSGARAIYFAFKDWGYAAHVSMLVRLIQEYSGLPYLKPYYSLEIDDCGVPETANADYISLIDWTLSSFGGYPTFAFVESFLDQNPPDGIMIWGLDPPYAANNGESNPNNVSLLAELRAYKEYVVASHAYQHDLDWWRWTATGIPVAPYADQDSDGTPNWQDSTIEGVGKENKNNPNLTEYSAGALVEADMAVQEVWFARMRQVLDSYGYSDSHVLIAPKFEYLDGYVNSLASQYGFYVLSAKPVTTGFNMTLGWSNDAYAPGRVAPSSVGTDPDVALDSAGQYLFAGNLMGYIGGYPLCLVTDHMWQFNQGSTPGYELRDSYLSSFGVMQKAGFKLVSTQTATNKNIGWSWTDMTSVQNSPGNVSLTLNSSAFQDGKARHELDIVMPFSIRQVKVGSNYCIYVDGNTLFYGKQSNLSETLQVLSGTYDSSLPRITSVSTPATDVLNAVYDPTSGKISLMLDGTFTTSLNLSNFKRPFSQGTTSIGSNGNSVLTIGLTSTASPESVNMSIVPSSGSVDVAVQTWNTSGAFDRQWTESSGTPGATTLHTIGDLTPGENYAVWYTKDGGSKTYWQTLQADGAGRISFNYDKGYSTVLFELRAAPRQPSNLSPASGATGVTVTPALQSSAFSDPNPADTHTASQWQIATVPGNYNEPSLVYDSGVDTLNLTESCSLSLEYSTDYYWRVKYRDNHGAWSRWSAETSFTTGSASGSPPSQPSNSLPANGATVVVRTPILEASPYSDSDNHTHAASRWQIYTAPNEYSSPIFDSSVDTSNLITIASPLLGYSTTYYWHVRYCDSSGAWSSWSTETSFTTIPDPNHPPSQPGNVSPVNGVTDVSRTPTLGSSAFSDPDAGDTLTASWWQMRTSSGTVLDQIKTVGDLTQYTLADALSYSTTYYWKVAYQDNHGAWSSWSTETSFTTVSAPNQAPSQPVNSAPDNGATGVIVMPILLSSAFSDFDAGDTHAASQWQITTAAGGYSSPVFDSGTDTLNLTRIPVPSGKLAYSTTYYWRVAYQDNHGTWSDWSEETHFATASAPNQAPSQPSNSLPANGATGVTVTPTPVLTSSAFSDLDAGDTHAFSQWQITTTALDYSAPVFDSGADEEHLISIGISSLKYSTTYYWHVRYQDNHGAWSSWSTETSFTTMSAPNQAPSQPVNSSPVNGATGQSLTPALVSSTFSDPDGDTHAASQWQITTTAGNYATTVFDNVTGAPNLTNRVVPSGALSYSTTYFWHVRHQDSRGAWSSWSTETSFTTMSAPNQAPSQSVNSSPVNGATGQSLTPALVSSTFSDPDGDTHAASQWQIRTSSGSYYAPVLDRIEAVGILTEYTLTQADALSYSTTYYWRVAYQDNRGAWSDYSMETSFTTLSATNEAPSQPVNSSPDDGATWESLTPTLVSSAFFDPDGDTHAASQWQITATAGNYSSVAFDSLEDVSNLTSIVVPSGRLNYSTTYYWRVRHKDNQGNWSDWSTETHFATAAAPNQAPSQPANSSPDDGATWESLTPTLVSSAFFDPDVDTHAASQWQITTTAGDYSSPVFDSGSDTSSLTSIVSPFLDHSTTYYWRVRYLDSRGAWSSWSAETSFTTASLPDTTAPAISAVNSSSLTVSGATITWSTNEAATTQVKYGLTEEYGLGTTEVTSLVTSHSVDLTGLRAGKTYHYQVISNDAANNQAISTDAIFTTAASSGGMPVWAWVIIGLAAVGVLGAGRLTSSEGG